MAHHGRRDILKGIFGLALTALAGLSLASPAGAKVVVDKVTGHSFGVLAAPRQSVASSPGVGAQSGFGASGTPTCDTRVDSNCPTLLTSHGGPVQHGEKDILFFWDPSSFSSNPAYVAGMQTWLSDLAAGDFSTGNSGGSTGNPMSVVEQYYDMSGPSGTQSFVPYAVQNGGTVIDNDAYPGSGCTDSYSDFAAQGSPTVTFPICLTAAQIQTEVSNYVAAHGLPTGINVEYFVLTPHGVGSCTDGTNASCAVAQYCGWHTITDRGPNQIVFADMPFLAGTTCDLNRDRRLPNIYTSGIDPVVGVFSHELAETMTDPDLNGWYGVDGTDEIGDKCAYQYDVGQSAATFTGLPHTSAGAFFNTTLNGRVYLLQMEYDNRAGGCNQWNTDIQPTATISGPAELVIGTSPVPSFTLASVSDPAGIAYVNWYFGDGQTATTVGTAAIQHAYQRAGTFTVTAIVTDNHGNESKRTKTIKVFASLQALLASVVKPTGAAARIGALLRNGGYAFTFNAPTAGVLQAVWKHGTVVVALLRDTFSAIGAFRVKVALTQQGRSLLTRASSLQVSASDSFTPQGASPVNVSAAFTLVR